MHRGRARERVKPRGIMLLSPPGCGKSEFCKCLGNEVGRPVLILDVGSLMGSLVGQSEERTRQALATVDAMAPCVLMIDEVEKAFAGSTGQSGDSGVSSRMLGTFLSWLNDHESDVFVFALRTTSSGCRLSSLVPSVSMQCSFWTCPVASRRTTSGRSTFGTMDSIPMS